jgi:hypothetical protein
MFAVISIVDPRGICFHYVSHPFMLTKSWTGLEGLKMLTFMTRPSGVSAQVDGTYLSIT